jgi:hypothetical protein
LRVPFALNGQVTLYWGNLTFTEGPFYAGAAICFLFVLGRCLVNGPVKWGTLYAALLAMLLGTGGAGWSLTASLVVLALPLVYLALYQRLANVKPEFLGLGLAAVGLLVLAVLGGQPDTSYKLADFFFDYVPLYTKFRAPSTFLVLIGLTFPLLGMLAVQRFLSDELADEAKQRALLVAAGLVGGLCLLLGVAPGMFFDFKGAGEAELMMTAGAQDQQQYQAILADRASVLQADAWRSLAFILLTAGLLFTWLKGWLRQPLVIGAGLLVIVLADNLNVSRRYLTREDYIPEDQYAQRFAPQPADQYLKTQDTSYYRVYRISRGVGSAFNEAFTSYHLRSIGGYNAAKIRRYQQLFERHLSQLNPAALNMLNTRYIISSVQNQDINRFLSATGQYDTIFAPPGGELVFYNKFANPPAWLVANTIVVPTPDDALDTLGRINPYITAVVEQPWATQVSKLDTDSLDRATETIRLEGHELNFLRYKARTTATRLAVFSEIYYPGGWKATVNGQPAEILQVNFVLRAVVLPPGEHTIEFRFAPDTIQRGEMLSWAGTGIMLLLLALGIVMDFRRKPAEA